jgi:hypothetical protein
MSEKTLVYEGAEGVETVRTERLQYESNTDCWRFEPAGDGTSEIVRVPRERIYEIRQRRGEREEDGRDRCGHP